MTMLISRELQVCCYHFSGDRCPPLPSVNHVTPSTTNTTQGINITMTVDIGYKINDTMMDYVVECGSDLQWNGTFYNATGEITN